MPRFAAEEAVLPARAFLTFRPTFPFQDGGRRPEAVDRERGKRARSRGRSKYYV